MSPLPRLAITLGDPAGIGPETVVGAWSNDAVHACARPLAVGRPELLERAAQLLKRSVRVVAIDHPRDAAPAPDTIPCLVAGNLDALDVPPGVVDSRGGQAAFEALAAAARLALAKDVDGIVTAPLNKAALHAAGHSFPGHTELLRELCGAAGSAMMLYLPPRAGSGGPAGLGVVHVTLHMALRDVPRHLTTPAIVERARWADDILRRLDVDGKLKAAPRIAVAALNPHAGEQGLFGDEETRIIAPAVAEARRAGLSVAGPLAVDTLMVRARDGEFDAVVAMYHDQGHIALKLMDMHHAVNITLGLPIVRASVAHGTAFDRAWQGTAETTGMVEAIRVAAALAGKR